MTYLVLNNPALTVSSIVYSSLDNLNYGKFSWKKCPDDNYLGENLLLHILWKLIMRQSKGIQNFVSLKCKETNLILLHSERPKLHIIWPF